jgi:hypothetical protein
LFDILKDAYDKEQLKKLRELLSVFLYTTPAPADAGDIPASLDRRPTAGIERRI